MTKRTLAALSSAAVLLAAAGCGKNEDAKLDENGRLPVSTQNADNTYTPAPATTSVPSADYDPAEQTHEPEQQYSTAEEPTSIVTWTQEYSVEVYESGHGGGKKSGNGSTTEPPSDPGSCYTQVSPDDWYNAIDAEYQACGGVTSCVYLDSHITYNGVIYGIYKQDVNSSEVSYYNVLYSIGKDNNGKILRKWANNTTSGISYSHVYNYFCNGRFYAYDKSGYGTADGVSNVLMIYDIEGNYLGSYTTHEFNPWETTIPDYTGRLHASLHTICSDGKILTSDYVTEDTNDNNYRYYIDGNKVPEPTPANYGYPETFYPKSIPAVKGMYKNKVYMYFEGLYGEKYHFWLDTDTLEWHELPYDIDFGDSSNYAVGRYLFTDDMVYDMEEDKVLFTSAEDERGILSSKKYLYGDRNVVADAEGVTVYPAGGGDGVKVLEWE